VWLSAPSARTECRDERGERRIEMRRYEGVRGLRWTRRGRDIRELNPRAAE
jgi:hypothetical protein